MFREMRRRKQQLSDEECQAVLEAATSGVLSVIGDDGYPYGVPMSFACVDDRHLVFHSATSGHKIDALRANPKASFTVIGKDDVVPEEYTTYFRSVVAFGKVRIVDDDSDKIALLKRLGSRYRPGHPVELNKEATSSLSRVLVLEFEIEHITGKQARELMHP